MAGKQEVHKRFIVREHDGKVQVLHAASGEVICEVIGNLGVDRMARGKMLALGFDWAVGEYWQERSEEDRAAERAKKA